MLHNFGKLGIYLLDFWQKLESIDSIKLISQKTQEQAYMKKIKNNFTVVQA